MIDSGWVIAFLLILCVLLYARLEYWRRQTMLALWRLALRPETPKPAETLSKPVAHPAYRTDA